MDKHKGDMVDNPTHSYPVNGMVRNAILSILVITTILVVTALWLGSQMEAHLRWTEHGHEVRSTLDDLEIDALRAESGVRGYLLVGQDEFLAGYERLATLSSQLDKLSQLITDNAAQPPRATALRQAIEEKAAFLNQCIRLRRANQEPELKKLLATGEGLRTSQEIHRIVAEMNGVETGLLLSRRESAQQSQESSKWALLGGLSIELVLGFVMLAFIGQRLRPLSDCANFAERIGRGDLTSTPLAVQAYDEVGRVATCLNQMLVSLRGAFQQSQSSADVINTTTAAIALATREQAVALQQQFAAMQQTSVTLDELGQSASQIAERAREVASRAEATAQAANQGLESVRRSVSSTQLLTDQVQAVASRIFSLGEKTLAIRSIVLTVNDIAERSNVLALNAAILAAAAGPEGKSFTVVANEMKNLADQSKEATVQVRDLLGEVERGIQVSVVLIEEASKRGLAGSAFTDESSVAIHHLAGQVMDGNQAFQQIVAATNQQKLAFEQVAEALLSIRQTTQQSAANTQQLEQATRQLHLLSGELLQSLAISTLLKGQRG